MQLTHSFTVPVSVDEAFKVLRDIELIAPCMPGASLDEVEGDRFTGKVKVKVGPIQVTYQGEARFADVDEDHHRATIEANAKESRGAGTARATITAECRAKGDETDVTVVTDLAITGKPAQFGRGVMSDVGEKLLGRFADCLSDKLQGDEGGLEATPTAGGLAEPGGTPPGSPGEERAEEATSGSGGTGVAGGTAASAAGEGAASASAPPLTGPSEPARVLDLERDRGSDEAIDLFEVAGASVLKRLAPVALGLAVLALVVWLIKRR